MNFAEEMTAELVQAEKAQTTEARQASAEKTRKFSLQAIVTWLLAFMAGKVTENVRVEMTTDKIHSFLNLGGLPEFSEIFREFFEKTPGMFFVYDLPKLWEKLSAFPAEQRFVGRAYINRAMNHSGEGEDFHYAVKAAMCIYTASGASAESFKVLAKNLVAKHATALLKTENVRIANMLDSISKSGRYYMPSNIPTPAQGAKEKGDDDRRNNGNNRHSLPAKKYAKLEDVGGTPGKATPATPEEPAEDEKKIGNLGEALSAAGVKGKKKRQPKLTLKVKKAATQFLNGAGTSQTASA